MFHHSGGGGAFRRMIRHSIARCWVKNTARRPFSGHVAATMMNYKMKGAFLFLKPKLNVLLQLMSRDLRKHSLSWGLRDWEFTNITGKTDGNSITHKFSSTTQHMKQFHKERRDISSYIGLSFLWWGLCTMGFQSHHSHKKDQIIKKCSVLTLHSVSHQRSTGSAHYWRGWSDTITTVWMQCQGLNTQWQPQL